MSWQGGGPQPGSRAWRVPEEALGPAPGLEFGGFGARLVAYLVDAFIAGLLATAVAMLGIIVLVAGARTDSEFVSFTGVVVIVVGVVVVSLAYFPWFWVHGGATPGMRLFDLRVVRDVDGGPVSGGQAVLRLVGYWISSAIFYLGFIWVLVDKRRRGWHDLLAGTVVVRRARGW